MILRDKLAKSSFKGKTSINAELTIPKANPKIGPISLFPVIMLKIRVANKLTTNVIQGKISELIIKYFVFFFIYHFLDLIDISTHHLSLSY